MTASALLLSSAHKASVFSEINPVPPLFFFTQNPSSGKVLWQSKLEKKIIDQIFATLVFVLIYVYIYVIFSHKLLK